MIAYITGKKAMLEPAHVVVETSGLGYLVRISLHTYEHIKEQEHVKLLTYFQIREDAHTLFGFAEAEEKRMFEWLLGVNGVSGNIAMTILSGIHWAELQRVLRDNDKERLKKVRGVGPKTAERILLELRDKLGAAELPAASPTAALRNEAVLALVSLGFPRQTMEQRVDDLLARSPEPPTVEALIKQALKS